MGHYPISFYKKSQWIAIGAISFLLLTVVVIAGQFASQDNTKSNNDSALVASAAYAQFANPGANDTLITTSETNESLETLPATTAANSTTTMSSNSNNSNKNYLQNALLEIRGDLGSTIASADNDRTQVNQTSQDKRGEEYIVTGRWRVIANQSLLERFVANLTVARTDGMESHNIIMEDEGPFFALRTSSNNNSATSNITTIIYRNDYNLSNITAPVHLEIRGNSTVKIVTSIGENLQPFELQILRLLDEKPVYGTIQTITEEAPQQRQ